MSCASCYISEWNMALLCLCHLQVCQQVLCSSAGRRGRAGLEGGCSSFPWPSKFPLLNETGWQNCVFCVRLSLRTLGKEVLCLRHEFLHAKMGKSTNTPTLQLHHEGKFPQGRFQFCNATRCSQGGDGVSFAPFFRPPEPAVTSCRKSDSTTVLGGTKVLV